MPFGEVSAVLRMPAKYRAIQGTAGEAPRKMIMVLGGLRRARAQLFPPCVTGKHASRADNQRDG